MRFAVTKCRMSQSRDETRGLTPETTLFHKLSTNAVKKC
jgi:hypothetical protein